MSSAAGRTKIVATIGPASSSPELLRALIIAGMDVARLNLAHGTAVEHVDIVGRIRSAAAKVGRVVAILADLPGPKPRIGELGPEGLVLADGSELLLCRGDAPITPARITVMDDGLLDLVKIGDRIVIGDDAVSLSVKEVHSEGVRVGVMSGGHLRGRPGIRLAGSAPSASVPTPRDIELLKVVVHAGVDLVGVSFVRSAADINRVRAQLAAAPASTTRPLLVAKIETVAAVEMLNEIVNAADVVMVARGDLGISCPIEDVPHLQKRIIEVALRHAKPVITATQMLESMVSAPEPTRAEASDVANAVLDGTDAVMLSGETAIGHDPVRVVATIGRISRRADAEATAKVSHARPGAGDSSRHSLIDALTFAACRVAAQAGATAILCYTRTGATARAVARFRPAVPLVGFTADETTQRQLALSWGVQPLMVERRTTTDEIVAEVVTAARLSGVVAAEDLVVVITGSHVDERASDDQLRVVRVI